VGSIIPPFGLGIAQAQRRFLLANILVPLSVAKWNTASNNPSKKKYSSEEIDLVERSKLEIRSETSPAGTKLLNS
jgi:hypothetical protein